MNSGEPRFSAPPAEGNPVETLALVALGAGFVAAALMWTAGEVAGRLFAGRWPHVAFADMPGVLARLGQHGSDPAAAWPPEARALLPGPAGFYAVLAALVVPAFVVALLVVRWRIAGGSLGAGSARWARGRDLRALRVPRPQAGRLTLGRVDGRLVAAEPRQSVIVIGPTQTGKTSGFAIPAMLEWAGPVIATSVKSDLLRDTVDRRGSVGDVYIYDPTRSTGMPTCGWSPLTACVSWQGAQRMASWIVAAAQQRETGLENADFWYASAAKLLAPLLLSAACSGLDMSDVVRLVDAQEEVEVIAGLREVDAPSAELAFEATRKRDPKTRSGVYTTAETVLAAYADPGVLGSALTSDLRPERLLDGGCHTAYLCAPAHEQRRLQPLFAALVQEIVAAVYERATSTGVPLDPPLLLVLDECANIAPLRDLATLASTGAGQGIQLVSVFQDMAQINAVYGRDRTPTIVANHRAKVILSGVADAATLEYVSRLLGDEQIRHVSQTSGAEGRRSTTESVSYRALAPSNVLREMRPGQGVLVYGHLAPARLELRPWFKERRMRRAAPPATSYPPEPLVAVPADDPSATLVDSPSEDQWPSL